jgi:hypothetical protein
VSTALRRVTKAGTTAVRVATTTRTATTTTTAATTRPTTTTAAGTSVAGAGAVLVDPGGTMTIAPTFKATVKLPAPMSGTLRLVVKEFELHYEDEAGVFLGKKIARRLVYVDTIALT